MKDPVCGMEVGKKVSQSFVTERNTIFAALHAGGLLSKTQSNLQNRTRFACPYAFCVQL